MAVAHLSRRRASKSTLPSKRRAKRTESGPQTGPESDPPDQNGPAERVRDFLRDCVRHSKGQFAGKPFELLPWQWESFIKPVFGRIRPDGLRLTRFVYLSVAKKQGKSSLMAGLVPYGLLLDGEPGAEIYSVAEDREQAAIVFREAANMIRSSPELDGQFVVIESRKRIVCPSTNSFYQAMSSEVGTKEGINAHMIFFDELHTQKQRDLFDALRYAGASRRQPLFVMMTTAGYDKHSICYEQYQHAKNVEAGVVDDPAFLSCLFEVDPEDDWTDEKLWIKANPSLGTTVNIEDLRRDCEEAKRSVAIQNRFRRYRLNQWVAQETRWIDCHAWRAAKRDDVVPEGSCFGGLDLASTSDLNALVLAFPTADGIFLKSWFWVPLEQARNRHLKRVPYLDWIEKGQMVGTEGKTVDYAIMLRDILAILSQYHCEKLAVDRLFQGLSLCKDLEGEGVPVDPMGQGFLSMAGPTKEFERLLLDNRLTHDGNEVLTWNAENVVVEMDAAGNIKPTKAKSGDKIDGIVAAIMAVGKWAEAEAAAIPGIAYV